MSKSRFSYSIEIDHERHTVTVSDSINGHKSRCPIYLSCQANAYDVAQACRAAAFQLLERADGIEHSSEFYHAPDVDAQISAMQREHKPTFS